MSAEPIYVEVWGGENDGQVVPIVNDVTNPGWVKLTYANGTEGTYPLWNWRRMDGSVVLKAIVCNGPAVKKWVEKGHA